MKLRFKCSACGTELESAGSTMGSKVACPTCQTTLAIPRDNFTAGTQIAGFEIIRLLGTGGMGEVYLAKQLSMNREVALKVLSAEFAAAEGAVARFLQEVHMAAKLEHPNIVTAFDAGDDEGLYYMAMSYIRGQSLADQLDRKSLLTEKAALQLTRKMAGALNYAWQHHKIIHRDIKPANILLDEENVPKLADMGLSKSVEEEEALTLSGEVMGTPNYMSPEQIEGRNDVDFRADIYSLGATLYHMLTGRMPFAGSSVLDVLRKQAIAELPDPRNFHAALSEHCVSLLQIMLAKKREERQADWTALLADIDAVLHNRPPATKVPATGHSVLVRRGHTAHHGAKMGLSQTGPLTPKSAPTPRSPAPTTSTTKAPSKVKLWIGLSLLSGGIICIVFALVVMLGNRRAAAERSQKVEAAKKAALDQAQAERAKRDKDMAELWQTASDFAKTHPESFDVAIKNFTDIQTRLVGTKYEVLARAEIDRLRSGKSEAMTKVFSELTDRAKALADRQDFNGAAELLANYKGAFASELRSLRSGPEKKYRTLAAAAAEKLTQAEREQRERWQNALNTVADTLLSGDIAKTRQLCQATAGDTTLNGDKDPFQRMVDWLDQIVGADKILLDSFAAQRNTLIELPLNGAKTKVRIAGVRGDRIQIERPKGIGWIVSECSLAQLPFEEKQARLNGKIAPAALGLWSGLVLLKANQAERAAEQFKGTGEFAPLLQARLEGARQQLLARAVSELPPDEQVVRVATELKALNVGFDGRMTHKIENRQITELTLSADTLTDLSPVGGLKNLRRLTCCGSTAGKRGSLANLTPLAGLPLTMLCVSNTCVADLTPLKGAPLTMLLCDNTPLSDLGPLTGMKLAALCCNNTSIRDLGPLEGMPLLSFGCLNTDVEDLSPLKNMPLQSLKCDMPLALQNAPWLRGLRTLTTINDSPVASFWLRTAGQLPAAKADQGQPLTREKKNGKVNVSVSKDNVQKIPFDYKERPPKDSAGKELVFREKCEKYFFRIYGDNAGGHRWVTWEDAFPLELGKRLKLVCYVRSAGPAPIKEVFGFNFSTTKHTQLVKLSLRDLPEKTWIQAQAVFDATLADVNKIQLTANTSKQEVDICDVRLAPALPGDETGLLLPQVPTATTNATAQVTTSAPTISAKEQVRRFTEEMKALNPDFDGIVTYDATAGKVLKLRFSSQSVSDLSPIRMFSNLEELYCATPSRDGAPIVGRGKLADLSPLKGLPLVKLNCSYASITDLSPLANLPLQWLNVDGNLLTNLDILSGMKLTSLDTGQMGSLTSIAGLQGMPLTYLKLDGTRVADLMPIADCPLKTLCLRFNSSVKDISPLQRLKLDTLYLATSRNITSLEPLRNIPLSKLDIRGVPCDLAPLKGMVLKDLTCNFDPDKHTSLLRSLKALNTINGLPADEFTRNLELALLAEEAPGTIKLDADTAALSGGLKLENKQNNLCVAYWTKAADTFSWPIKGKGKYTVIVKAGGQTASAINLQVGNRTLTVKLAPASGDYGIINYYIGDILDLPGGAEQTLIISREEGKSATVNIFGIRLYPSK